ncbi:hypothetical protein [Mycobacterium scrofulaceum]|uniref:Uncharacterized protein n=1 Tax=Mycobacterium scrofulaceum TaxID=1783 RepID=A0A1A2UCL5_MYCSC|nr:hypothetical protein [Mycobacterium scrofulaceum]OBH86643.1 hypothetical protein A5679_26875 [Mycobacterium scrofulaceum]
MLKRLVQDWLIARCKHICTSSDRLPERHTTGCTSKTLSLQEARYLPHFNVTDSLAPSISGHVNRRLNSGDQGDQFCFLNERDLKLRGLDQLNQSPMNGTSALTEVRMCFGRRKESESDPLFEHVLQLLDKPVTIKANRIGCAQQLLHPADTPASN